MKVKSSGEVVEKDQPVEEADVFVGTRFKELQVAKAQDAERSRDGHLAMTAENLFHNGPGNQNAFHLSKFRLLKIKISEHFSIISITHMYNCHYNHAGHLRIKQNFIL